MHVLILGGTRFIGRAIADAAQAAGHRVTLFNRGQTDPDPPFDLVRGDVNALDEHAPALRALQPDAVVHCVAYTEAHGADLVAAFRGAGAKLIVLGSQDCYRAFSELRDGRDAGAFPLDEQSPLAPPFYWRGTPHPHADDYDKNLLTQALLAGHEAGDVEATVLRLPMVYGPRDPQAAFRHAEILWHVLDAREDFVLGANQQATIWTFGYVANVAAAVVHALSASGVWGQAFNVSETRVRSFRSWAEGYAQAAGHSFEYRIVPDAALDAETEPDAPPRHWISDCSHFARSTGFTPPVTHEQALRETLTWARANPDALGERPDYAKRLAVADAFRAGLPALRGQ